MMIKDKLLIGLFALALPFNAGAVTFASADSTQQEVKKANGKADKEKKDDKAADKKKEKDEYAELIKKSVSLERGLFDVRHIEDKWYFDVPDSLLGRYILAVTRLTGVPQGVGKFSPYAQHNGYSVWRDLRYTNASSSSLGTYLAMNEQ